MICARLPGEIHGRASSGLFETLEIWTGMLHLAERDGFHDKCIGILSQTDSYLQDRRVREGVLGREVICVCSSPVEGTPDLARTGLRASR
jgi:hypothetical protein